MRKEADRRKMAFEEVKKGVDVAMVCSGDSGIYGMAGLIYEIGRDYPEIGIEIVPRDHGGIRRSSRFRRAVDA